MPSSFSTSRVSRPRRDDRSPRSIPAGTADRSYPAIRVRSRQRSPSYRDPSPRRAGITAAPVQRLVEVRRRPRRNTYAPGQSGRRRGVLGMTGSFGKLGNSWTSPRAGERYWFRRPHAQGIDEVSDVGPTPKSRMLPDVDAIRRGREPHRYLTLPGVQWKRSHATPSRALAPASHRRRIVSVSAIRAATSRISPRQIRGVTAGSQRMRWD